MGRVETSGLDELIRSMSELAELDGEISKKIVFSSAGIIKKRWKLSISAQRHIKTGSMNASIVYPKKVSKTQDGTYIDVSPSGEDENGTRNAQKAAILNYGTSTIPGSFFIDSAEASAETTIEPVSQKIWDDYLKQKKGL